MSIWLFRAGSNGEYENKFLTDGRIYLTWDYLNKDLSTFTEQRQLYDFLVTHYKDEKMGRVRNWTGQVWPIAHKIKEKDWVILPSKHKSVIHIGEVTSGYNFNAHAENPFYHFRTVNWFALDIPRSKFDQDILYSLGAFMTVCEIKRNDAEKRIRSMAKNNWEASSKHIMESQSEVVVSDENTTTLNDLEQVAKDQIARFLEQKFAGHGLTRLVNEILKAKGYVTYLSPEGPDKGVDILAAPEPMGFGSPKICVQVKSGANPIDRPTLDQLIGSMHNFKAENGLFVSWNGFKSSVDKEIPAQFFNVRLWSQIELIDELYKVYDKLDEEIKNEIPLKRVWTLSLEEG